MANPLLTFNAKSVDPEILEKTMVGRKEIIDRIEKELLVKIKKNQTYQSLLVAPRGSGKTHMTRVLYNRLKTNKEIEDKIVIAYMIEDEVGIANFLDFIVRILDSFTRYSEKNSNYLKEAIYEISNRADRQEAALKNLLLDFLDGKTLVVLIENLNVIFEGMGVQGQSRLRDFIHEQNNISIIATSQNLSNVKESKYPFYNFFKTTHLQKLDFKESFDFMKSIANAEGKSTMISEFESSKMKGKIRAIYELTGGNHRLLVEFYSFLRADIKSELSQVFVKTMNSLKPYYEQFVSVLPVQQQKIVKHISLKHIPQKGKDIARSCFMQQNTASKQLSELYKKGYLDKHKEGKETFYELREPLMRICFEIGESPDGIAKLFINFLSIIYSSEEIKSKFLKNKYAAKLKPLEIREKYQLEAQMMGKALDTETLKELLNLPELEKCVSENEVEEKIEEYNSKRFEKEHGISKEIFIQFVNESVLFNNNEKAIIINSVSKYDRSQVEKLLEKINNEKSFLKKNHVSKEIYSIYVKNKDKYDLLDLNFLNDLKKKEIFKNDYTLYYLFGLSLVDKNKFKESIEAFRKCISLNPNIYECYQFIGDIYYEIEQYEESILAYNGAVDLKPLLDIPYMGIGNSFKKLGKLELSAKAFKKASVNNPKNDQAFLSLSEVYFKMYRYKDAANYLKIFAELKPENKGAYRGIGIALLLDSSFVDAAQAFKTEITYDKNNYENYYLLGNCYVELGKYDAAIYNYKEAININPESSNIFNNLGSVYKKTKDLEHSKEYINKGLTLDNNNIDLNFSLLSILLQENNFEKSQSLFIRCMKLVNDKQNAENYISEDVLLPLLKYSTLEFFISYLRTLTETDFTKAKNLLWDAFPTAIFEVLVNIEDYDQERLTWIEKQLNEFFGEEEKMKISLLMLNVGIRYLKHDEKKAIYDLSKEERKVFQEFILDKRK